MGGGDRQQHGGQQGAYLRKTGICMFAALDCHVVSRRKVNRLAKS
jgi:hypothetical protein